MRIALILVIFGVTLVLILLIGIAGASITDFIAKSDGYRLKLVSRFEDLREWLPYDEIEQWLIEKGWITLEQSENFLASFDYFGAVMGWFKGFLTSLYGSVRQRTIWCLLTLIFMLAEASGLPRKLVAVTGGRHLLAHESTRVRDAILHYMSLKTLVSLLTGILAGTLVWGLDVDYPVLWGLIAFFFNYVPNIGSFIAAIPPVLLALIQNDFQVCSADGHRFRCNQWHHRQLRRAADDGPRARALNPRGVSLFGLLGLGAWTSRDAPFRTAHDDRENRPGKLRTNTLDGRFAGFQSRARRVLRFFSTFRYHFFPR